MFVASALLVLAWRSRDQPLAFELPRFPKLDAEFFAVTSTVAVLKEDGPLRFPLPSPARVNDKYFNDKTEFGHFGEVLTGVMLASEGWIQLQSHTPGARGLDGIFVRPEGSGHIVLLVETKTTGVGSDNYDPEQMSDEYVKRLILGWKTLDDANVPIADAIAAAIDRRSRYVRKELWEHDTLVMNVNVFALGRDGEKLQRFQRGTDKDPAERLAYERLVRAVATNLKTYYRSNKVPLSACATDLVA